MTITADRANFQTDVLERSYREPVVVDFWAEWCGPCHQLAPILDRVAARYEGEVALAKVDIDANPDLARAFRVQGIPSVKAFADGAIVAEFTGVQPEQAVEQFFAQLAPSEADRLVVQAAASDAPEPLLRQALAAEPGHKEATLALARIVADAGEVDEALALLDKLPPDDDVRALRSRLHLSTSGGDIEDLRSAAEAGDPAAKVSLGRALAGRGDYEEAVEMLLAAVADPTVREDARQAVLEVFDVLGPGDELVRRARPRLASMLYA